MQLASWQLLWLSQAFQAEWQKAGSLTGLAQMAWLANAGGLAQLTILTKPA